LANAGQLLPTTYSAPRAELGLLQVGGVEALGEPVVDLGEHRACLVVAVGITQQPMRPDLVRNPPILLLAFTNRRSHGAGQLTAGLTLWFTEKKLVGS
jgi:hypothetical protein